MKFLTAIKEKLNIDAIKSSKVVRWWIVGIFFMGFNIPLLYLFVDLLNLPLSVATLIAGELGTVLRFFANERWVFHQFHFQWKRLYQYHLAVVSSFLIWYTVTNFLPTWGIHYILASILATGCSVGWSMITNFLWVWKKNNISDN